MTIQRSRTFKVSPEHLPALRRAVFVNINTHEWTPAYVQTMDTDQWGNFLVEILGYDTYFDKACVLAGLAEAGRAVIMPARNRNSEHAFTPGDTVTFDAELYHVGVFTSKQYGQKFIHRFQDRDGNEFTWTTNTMCLLGDYRITAKVKAHEEYFGVCQTAITHCRFESLAKGKK